LSKAAPAAAASRMAIESSFTTFPAVASAMNAAVAAVRV